MQANVHLIDSKEMHQLEAFSQSLCAIHSFIEDSHDSGSSEHFLYMLSTEPWLTSHHNSNNAGERLYSDLPVATNASHKKLTYLQCTLDTAGYELIMPVSIHMHLYYEYSLKKFGSVQG